MGFLWKGKGIAIYLSRSWFGPTERFIWGEGWLRLVGPCLGERFLFQDRTPERVDYIGCPALVMIVAFYKFGCIL